MTSSSPKSSAQWRKYNTFTSQLTVAADGEDPGRTDSRYELFSDTPQMTHCTSWMAAGRPANSSICSQTSCQTWKWESGGTADLWTCLRAAVSCQFEGDCLALEQWKSWKHLSDLFKPRLYPANVNSIDGLPTFTWLVKTFQVSCWPLDGHRVRDQCQNMNSRVQSGLLVVHGHGAAPLAGGDRGGAVGVGGPGAAHRELAASCGGHIGHITQTQASPRCPHTKTTCREAEEDVTQKERERDEEKQPSCVTTSEQLKPQGAISPKPFSDDTSKFITTNQQRDSYVSWPSWPSVAFGETGAEIQRRNLQSWTGRCRFSSSQLQPEDWRRADSPSRWRLCEALRKQDGCYNTGHGQQCQCIV